MHMTSWNLSHFGLLYFSHRFVFAKPPSKSYFDFESLPSDLMTSFVNIPEIAKESSIQISMKLQTNFFHNTLQILCLFMINSPFKFVHTSVLIIMNPSNSIKMTHAAHIFRELFRFGPREVVDDGNNVAVCI